MTSPSVSVRAFSWSLMTSAQKRKDAVGTCNTFAVSSATPSSEVSVTSWRKATRIVVIALRRSSQNTATPAVKPLGSIKVKCLTRDSTGTQTKSASPAVTASVDFWEDRFCPNRDWSTAAVHVAGVKSQWQIRVVALYYYHWNRKPVRYPHCPLPDNLPCRTNISQRSQRGGGVVSPSPSLTTIWTDFHLPLTDTMKRCRGNKRSPGDPCQTCINLARNSRGWTTIPIKKWLNEGITHPAKTYTRTDIAKAIKAYDNEMITSARSLLRRMVCLQMKLELHNRRLRHPALTWMEHLNVPYHPNIKCWNEGITPVTTRILPTQAETSTGKLPSVPRVAIETNGALTGRGRISVTRAKGTVSRDRGSRRRLSANSTVLQPEVSPNFRDRARAWLDSTAETRERIHITSPRLHLRRTNPTSSIIKVTTEGQGLGTSRSPHPGQLQVWNQSQQRSAKNPKRGKTKKETVSFRRPRVLSR